MQQLTVCSQKFTERFPHLTGGATALHSSFRHLYGAVVRLLCYCGALVNSDILACHFQAFDSLYESLCILGPNAIIVATVLVVAESKHAGVRI